MYKLSIVSRNLEGQIAWAGKIKAEQISQNEISVQAMATGGYHPEQVKENLAILMCTSQYTPLPKVNFSLIRTLQWK